MEVNAKFELGQEVEVIPEGDKEVVRTGKVESIHQEPTPKGARPAPFAYKVRVHMTDDPETENPLKVYYEHQIRHKTEPETEK